MSTLIVTEFVSLDGVMEAPGGEPGYAHAGWVGDYFTDELGAYKLEEQLAADMVLLGRRTYEGFAGAWPNREGEFAEKLNSMEKYVISTTMDRADWTNTTVISSDVGARVAALKQGDGGPILVAGSRTLVHTLLDAGLVDELHLQVFPVVLGSGMRVYPDRSEPIRLELASSSATPNGVLTQTYRLLAR